MAKKRNSSAVKGKALPPKRELENQEPTVETDVKIGEADVKSVKDDIIEPPSKNYTVKSTEVDLKFEQTLKLAGEYDAPIASTVTASYVDQLQRRFEGFKAGLIAERDRKLQEREAKLKSLRENVVQLREAVKQTTKDRVIATRELQTKLNKEIDDWRTSLPPPLYKRLAEVEDALDVLVKKIRAVEDRIQEDRDRFPGEIESRAKIILEKLNAFTIQFDEGQNIREVEEAKLFARLKEVAKDYVKLFDEEEIARKKDLEKLEIQASEQIEIRKKDIAEFRLIVEESLTTVHDMLVKENKERETGQKEVIEQIETYTNRLRSAVHSI